MTARDFCFWLQGFFEISKTVDLQQSFNCEQAACIQKHLALVFKHEIDPSMGPAVHQQELNQIHSSTGSDVIFRC